MCQVLMEYFMAGLYAPENQSFQCYQSISVLEKDSRGDPTVSAPWRNASVHSIIFVGSQIKSLGKQKYDGKWGKQKGRWGGNDADKTEYM